MFAGSILWRVVRPNLHDGSRWDEGSDGVPVLAVQTNALEETAMLLQAPSALSTGLLRPSHRVKQSRKICVRSGLNTK